MEKLFIEDLDVKGKKVLMRVDFNVPLDGEGNIMDGTRIEASLPSINYILNQGGSLILMSHLGRPRNAPSPALSLAPCAKMLSALIDRPVTMAPNCVGEDVKLLVDKLQPGDILLLENLRFHRAEEHPDEDPDFARILSSYGDCYVNDAFGTAHRKHSSTYTVAQYFPGKAAAGYLMENEIHFLGELFANPKRPFVALIGGAKISTKMGVIQTLLKKVDTLLIGGGMAYTFLKAQGKSIGNSIYEEELMQTAKECFNGGDKIVLPLDFVVAEEVSETAPSKVVTVEEGIPAGYQGVDIGPKTVELFSQYLKKAATTLWNGPVGVYELESFAQGTLTIAEVIANSSAQSVVGGGDSIAALNETDLIDNITHVSTGGGASLEFLEKGTLPGIEVLSEKVTQGKI